MKPYTITNPVIFRYLPRFLTLELSYKYKHLPTESINSTKSYMVNVMRNQERTGAQNQHYVHSSSAHIKNPVVWVRSFQIGLFSKFTHSLHIKFSKVAG